jgi:3'-5' exonuclease
MPTATRAGRASRLPTSSCIRTRVVEGTRARPLTRAREALASAPVVGLDCEWRPSHEGGAPPVSILQLATRDAVFVFDLLRLHASPALDAALARLLACPATVKCGSAILGDLRSLARSYPDMRAFRSARSVLDLKASRANRAPPPQKKRETLTHPDRCRPAPYSRPPQLPHIAAHRAAM